jgi:hypothetical protein
MEINIMECSEASKHFHITMVNGLEVGVVTAALCWRVCWYYYAEEGCEN